MGKLMFRLLAFGGFAALALQTAVASVHEIDFQSLYTASPLPDGWTHQKLLKSSPNSDWKGGAYFESREGWLRSPVFDAPIRSVTIEVETSNANPERRLYLHPISRGVEGETGFPLVPTTGRSYEAQTFDLADCAADQFVLKCTHDSGGLVIVKDKTKLDQAAARKKLEGKFLRRGFTNASRDSNRLSEAFELCFVVFCK